MSHSITIAKRQFAVSPRYAEGHVLTANEASTLNQTLFENLRNNFAKKAEEGGTQEEFDAYAEAYQFGVRTGGGGGSRDPVEIEAMNLARDAVRNRILSKGMKLADFTAKAISEAAAKLVDGNPSYRETARQRVAQMQAVAAESIDDDILAALSGSPAEREPAEPSAPRRKRAEAAE